MTKDDTEHEDEKGSTDAFGENALGNYSQRMDNPSDFPTESWQRVLDSRSSITLELENITSQLSGFHRRRAQDLKARLRRVCRTEDVLRDVDLLRICFPLIGRSDDLPVGDVQNSLCQVIYDPLPASSTVWRLKPALVYPLLVLGICSLVLAAFSVLIAPTFERMFDEFGLTLPVPTEFAFVIARNLPFAFCILAALLLVFILAWVIDGIRRRRLPSATGLIPWVNSSRRSAWAQCAWHLSMLLETGLAKHEAVHYAGQSNTTGWLRSGLIAHALSSDENASIANPPLDRSQQAAYLREVAAIFWERERSEVDSWLAWLTPMSVCLVGLIVGFFVVALFMPLVSLISGLS